MIDEYVKNINFNVYQSASVDITRSWYDREFAAIGDVFVVAHNLANLILPATFYRPIIDISNGINMLKNNKEINS